MKEEIAADIANTVAQAHELADKLAHVIMGTDIKVVGIALLILEEPIRALNPEHWKSCETVFKMWNEFQSEKGHA